MGAGRGRDDPRRGVSFEDKWCYAAVVRYSEEERDTTVQLQSAEYNGGVILTKMVEGMTDENILEGYMDDSMWKILDTLTFYDYQPQTELDYVPGIYSLSESGVEAPEREGADDADTAEEAATAGTTGAEIAAEIEPEDGADTTQEAVAPADQIILKKDHTGSLVSENTTSVLWGSTLLTEKNTERTYEYTVEGDSLYLNLNDTWCLYNKTGEIEESDNKLDDPEYVNELNRKSTPLSRRGGRPAGSTRCRLSSWSSPCMPRLRTLISRSSARTHLSSPTMTVRLRRETRAS